MDAKTLALRLTECGIPCPDGLPDRLIRYHEMLMDWNSRMDLTAVTDEAEMMDRHYVDSLMPLRFGLMPSAGRVIDVGTGAGFPGLPLALACPTVSFTLMDAQQKRLTFLKAVVDALAVENVTLAHSRAEDGAHSPEHRERYDLAVARGVASLAVLSEYLLPFVKVGGRALCWKGPALQDEMTQGKRAAHLLGGHVEEALPCSFPGRAWQHLLLPIQKTEKTARQYPRKAGTPGRLPLGASGK